MPPNSDSDDLKVPDSIPESDEPTKQAFPKEKWVLPRFFTEKPSSLRERNELFPEEKQHLFNWLFLAAIKVLAFVLLVMFLVRVWHFVTPFCWHWLSEPQVQELDRFLFSGVLGTLLGRNFDKAFGNSE